LRLVCIGRWPARCPILNFALFAKFGVGMLEADPNQQRPPVHCPVCVAYHCDFQFSIVISSAAGSSANADDPAESRNLLFLTPAKQLGLSTVTTKGEEMGLSAPLEAPQTRRHDKI
jgi:hypothetical protein